MPHQCVRCNTIYDDGAREILHGCSCGARLFFYIKKSVLKKAKEETSKLSDEDKIQIEKDIFEIVGETAEQDEPVVLDFEAIRVMKPGKFEIDLVHLFKDDPLIYKMGEGKYVIDINKSFEEGRDKKKKS
jgi:uncharacterized protein